MHTFPIAADVSVFGVEAVSEDALLLVGQFAGTLDFGQETLASQGDKDAFVARVCR